jgi:hypothetical protein
MTVAEIRPTPTVRSTDYTPLTLERSLGRVNELLVVRSNTDGWWTALRRAIDDVAGALELHRAQGSGPDGLHSAILVQHPRLAFDIRGLERDHDELATDVAELQEIVAGAQRLPGGMAHALAATTEVVARIRGYQRRLSTVLHEAYQRDLGESG